MDEFAPKFEYPFVDLNISRLTVLSTEFFLVVLFLVVLFLVVLFLTELLFDFTDLAEEKRLEARDFLDLDLLFGAEMLRLYPFLLLFFDFFFEELRWLFFPGDWDLNYFLSLKERFLGVKGDLNPTALAR